MIITTLMLPPAYTGYYDIMMMLFLVLMYANCNAVDANNATLLS